MSKKSIPFFYYPHVYKQYESEILPELTRVLESGAYILQKEVDEFENSVKAFVNAKYCVSVANGTDSLYLALLAAGIEDGDEVIMASHTYIATAAAVHFAGGVPILVECLTDRMIDPKSVEKAITSKTKFIMPTQLNGRTADMGKLKDIADNYKLIIIEDAAQALGAKYDGKFAGTFGLAGSISLYPAKLLGSFGDGGLLFTDDDDMYEKLYEMRDHGRNRNGDVVRWGVNSRLDNIQAAVLSVKLKHYQKDIDKRRSLAAIYHERLKGIEYVNLPPGPSDSGLYFDVYQNYEVDVDRREELCEHLRKDGIGSVIQWAGIPVHRHDNLGLEHFDLPITDLFFKRCFLLPMNTSLTEEDILYICSSIETFYS
jgi:dTDP-4-amino-4,6-dideoxygalactose transaminase